MVALSFFIERALSLVFESRLVDFDLTAKRAMAMAVATVVCVSWKFDALSIAFSSGEPNLLGETLTASVLAGGSDAVIKLFHDVLKVGNLTE